MDALDYWRLCEQLTVVQAALLIAGFDPSEDGNEVYVEGRDPHNHPPGYDAAKAAVSAALLSGGIEGRLVPEYEYDINGNVIGEERNSIDVQKSVVSVDSLHKWLSGRGFRSGFFFPEGRDNPEYLDPSHPRYAPKLAAAVKAWEETVDPESVGGKTPKQALMKWLREHASEYGLTDEDGKPNETGIDEISKVANWKPGGGAPKTPG